jgi:predicted transposase YbfD/YdcC
MLSDQSASALASLIECFSEVPDPRIERCQRHKLIDIITITLCAVLTGAEGPTEMEAFGEAKQPWLQQFLELPNGIPSHDTFGRVLSLLDPKAFEHSLLKWVQANVKLQVGDIVPIDGKTLRGSHDEAHQQEAIEIVSAWAVSQRLTLGQVKVSADSNEITAAPQVLDLLNVEGCTVTIDALHCQKNTVAKVRERKADYVVALKKNQKHLYEAVADFLTGVRERCCCHKLHEAINEKA